MRAFLTLVLMAWLLATGSAQATEMWACHFATSKGDVFARYGLKENYLLEDDVPLERYNVLIDDETAIIGVGATALYGDDLGRGLPRKMIGTTTLAINRKTGDAIKGSVLLYGKNRPADHGSCHLETK